MSAQTFRRKPNRVEARKFNALDGWDAALDLAAWCGDEAVRDENPGQEDKTYYWSIFISSCRSGQVGTPRATPGWWIVKEADGAFSAISPYVFEREYEPDIAAFAAGGR